MSGFDFDKWAKPSLGRPAEPDVERELLELQRELNRSLLKAQELRNEEQRHKVRQAKAEADLAELITEHWRKQLALPDINTKDEGKA